MKYTHAHAVKDWAEQQRQRPIIRAIEREALFEEASRTLTAMHAVARGKDGSGAVHAMRDRRSGNTSYIFAQMSDEAVMVWSPERGYRIARIEHHPAIKEKLFRAKVSFEELTRITRRAFLPQAIVQIYKITPTMKKLLNSAQATPPSVARPSH